MVSDKQIAANRENAKLGGVKTKEGKQAIRLNAVTHGLLSKEVVLPGEDSHLMKELRDRLMTEYDPQGEMETILVERIVSSIWRLRRMLMAETKLIAIGYDLLAAYTVVDVARTQTLSRYETMIERQLYKAMHELERLQALRLGKNL
ncbi:MAG TPA: hypothetical protein VEH58_04820 [Dehalococcoidales bacterium]|nr:hypothetical protein [Dehalococcoidales bacterium]